MDFREALAKSLLSEPDKRLREAFDLFAQDEKKARKLYPELSNSFDAIIEEERGYLFKKMGSAEGDFMVPEQQGYLELAKRLHQLEVGESIFINKYEWTSKKGPSEKLNRIHRRTEKRFCTSGNRHRHGWTFTRYV